MILVFDKTVKIRKKIHYVTGMEPETREIGHIASSAGPINRIGKFTMTPLPPRIRVRRFRLEVGGGCRGEVVVHDGSDDGGRGRGRGGRCEPMEGAPPPCQEAD
jgi:hypothetical protein